MAEKKERSTLQTRRAVSPLLQALIGSSLVSIAFFAVRVIGLDSTRYSFMVWNLVLAWVPLVAAWSLFKVLRTRSWRSWQAIILTLLWLGFLPNSFYLISDLIHLFYSTVEAYVLFDVVMLMSFVWNGVILGYISLQVVHQGLRQRLSAVWAAALIYLVLLACSYAIYLGRYLRWNSWDILINPAGILFDVSDRIINPTDYPHMFSTTLSFFMLLGSMYLVIWRLSFALRDRQR